jgi:light-independent protochlorophyllide reductase subunit B
MQLTLWTYEGPPHIGAMRVATGMTGLHFVLHAPQGDSYADLLFTMIERRAARPPVTYTTFQARDLGTDTSEVFKTAAREAFDRFKPRAMIVGASCTAELLQDDPGGLARAVGLPCPVIPLELSAYSKKENWGAAETLYRLVRALSGQKRERPAREKPLVNLLGPTALGFRHRDDVIEITKLLNALGVDVNVAAPAGAAPDDLTRLGDADFNVALYPEIALPAAQYLEKAHGQPYTKTVPIGVGATRDFIAEVRKLGNLAADAPLPESNLPWWSRSVDSTYLTGKRVFIFGDATHVLAAERIAREEIGFDVVGLGTYSREFAREVRERAKRHEIEALITDDYLDVEAAIASAHPDLVLGTQMERHIAKRLRLPCAVISAPTHVQDFPARYAPQMGFEGANVIFDSWVHPLMMGLEEHLLGMFREDSEFHEIASHLGASHPGAAAAPQPAAPASGAAAAAPVSLDLQWSEEATKELKKIPFFVRGKARGNTEKYARERGLTTISVGTLYDAKAHYGR